MSTRRFLDPQRIIDELGATLHVAYGDDLAPSRLLLLHEPPRDRDTVRTHGVVVCSPLHMEANRTYRREHLLGWALARVGIPVQRFHYGGFGHSDGDPLAVGLDTLVDDTRWAADRLRSTTGVTHVTFLGIRLGAIVAAKAARDLPGSGLVLWEPVLDIDRYLHEVFRAFRLRGMRQGDVSGANAAELNDRLESASSIDVLGYDVTQRLRLSFAGSGLDDVLPDDPRRILVVQLGSKQTVRRETAALVERWHTRGHDVTATAVVDQTGWWFGSSARGGSVAVALSGVEAISVTVDHLGSPGVVAGLPRLSGHTQGGAMTASACAIPKLIERPLYLETPAGPIFAVESSPHDPPSSSTGVVLLPGGWYGSSTNCNRIFVRLGRRIAAQGHRVVRIDWRGMGESAGELETFRLDEPLVEEAVAAARHLLDSGADGVVFVGFCFGAHTGLAAAAAGQVPVHGVGLVSLSLPHEGGASSKVVAAVDALSTRQLIAMNVRPSVLKGWFHPATRAVYRKGARAKVRRVTARMRREPPAVRVELRSARERRLDRVVSDLSTVLDAGTRVLVVLGEDDIQREAFEAHRDGVLAACLARAGEMVQVREKPGDLHGFASLESQDHAIETVVGWIAELPNTAPARINS